MYQEIKKEIESFGFKVVSHDFERPWGGFLVIDESQAQDFSQFEEGIEKTVKWYLENQELLNNVTSGDYQAYYQKMYTK